MAGSSSGGGGTSWGDALARYVDDSDDEVPAWRRDFYAGEEASVFNDLRPEAARRSESPLEEGGEPSLSDASDDEPPAWVVAAASKFSGLSSRGNEVRDAKRRRDEAERAAAEQAAAAEREALARARAREREAAAAAAAQEAADFELAQRLQRGED